jgi:hypothetical protein
MFLRNIRQSLIRVLTRQQRFGKLFESGNERIHRCPLQTGFIINGR